MKTIQLLRVQVCILAWGCLQIVRCLSIICKHSYNYGVVHNCQHLPISTQSTNLGGGGAEAS